MVWKFFRRRQQPDTFETARVPPGFRIYAIGDIHGCVAQLDLLHEKIEEDLAQSPPDEGVALVYLGDYIDRGPDSQGVIERLLQPVPSGITRVLLKGNHEDMVLGFFQHPDNGEAWCNLGGYEALLSYRIDVKSVFEQGGFAALAEELATRMPAAHRQFLSELQPSWTIGGYFFCHAGVRPGVPIEQQDPNDLMWIRQDFLRSTANHGKRVVHGHSPVEMPDVHPNRINIDTGAYATGRLTAVVLEGEEHRFLHT